MWNLLHGVVDKVATIATIGGDEGATSSTLPQALQGKFDERVVKTFISVTPFKPGKDAKPKAGYSYYIVLTRKTEGVKLHFLKNIEGNFGRQTLKSFSLEALESVSFPESQPLGMTFVVEGKESTWLAGSLSERADFISILAEACQKVLERQPVDAAALAALVDQSDASQAASTAKQNEEDFKALDSFLTRGSIYDYGAITAGLAAQIAELEKESIAELISLPPKSADIAALTDESFAALEESSHFLRVYGDQIKLMREYIDEIEVANNRLEIASTNQRRLKGEIERLTGYRCVVFKTGVLPDILAKGSVKEFDYVLELAEETDAVTKEAGKFKERSDFFREQYDKASYVKGEICRCTVEYVVKLISDHLQSILSDEKHCKENCLMLRDREFLAHLESTSRLVSWIRKTSPERFGELIESVTALFKLINRKKFTSFVEGLHEKTVKWSKPYRRRVKNVLFYGDTVINAVTMGQVKKKPAFVPMQDGYPVPEAAEDGLFSPKDAIATVFETFQVTAIGDDEFLQRWVLPSAEGGTTTAEDLVQQFFEEIPPMLIDVVRRFAKTDPFLLLYAYYLVVSFHKHPVLRTYQTAFKKEVLDLFNAFIDDQVKEIKTTALTLKGAGITVNFQKFPLFIDYCDGSSYQLLKGTGKLPGDEKKALLREYDAILFESYEKLFNALCDWIDATEDPHPLGKHRYLAEVENLSYLQRRFEQKSNRWMDEGREKVAKRLNAAADAATGLLLDQRFGKMLNFFSEVSDALKTDIPANEIQFQEKFCKHACSTRISKFTAEKTRALLTALLKKLAKTVTPSGLDFLWHRLKDTMTQRWSRCSSLISKCYTEIALSIDTGELGVMIDEIWDDLSSKGNPGA